VVTIQEHNLRRCGAVDKLIEDSITGYRAKRVLVTPKSDAASREAIEKRYPRDKKAFSCFKPCKCKRRNRLPGAWWSYDPASFASGERLVL